MAPAQLTDDVQVLLQVVYDVFGPTGNWPVYQYVAKLLDQEHELDVASVLGEMPPGLVRVLEPARDETEVVLRVAGLVRCHKAERDAELFLQALRWCVAKEHAFRPPSATTSEQLRLTSAELATEWRAEGHEVSDLDLAKVHALLGVEMLFASLGGAGQEWELTLTREVARPYRRVETIDDYLTIVAERERPPHNRGPTRAAWPRRAADLRADLADSATQAGSHEPILRLADLHPLVQGACATLFRGEHYQEGVMGAYTALRDLVRERSGLDDPDDSSLMGKALGGNAPRIVVADRSTKSGENVQKGTVQLAQGIVARLRNPLAHERVKLLPAEAMEMVALISRVVRDVDLGRPADPADGGEAAATRS